MKQLTTLLFLTAPLLGWAQNTANSIHVRQDTDDVVLDKMIQVVPSQRQLEALQNEFIAFVHFGPNTFTRMEWGNGNEDPQIFDLKNLDTDQWCEAMKDAGMKMVILTVKHHDGFVLWQSRYTDHGIMSTGFENGKGDILKNLSESCKKYGLKLGIYLSPADLYQIESPDGLYGNESKQTLRTIPRETPGRPFADSRSFEFVVDDYNEYFLNQLFELLTEYGPVHEVWFDGAHPKRKGGQTYNYPAWRELIRTLAPNAVIFGREDIRWCGNEAGATRESEWNVISYDNDPDTTTVFSDMHGDLGSREVLLARQRPFYLHYQPAETNTSIRDGWFYRDDKYQKVRSADDIFDIYERSVGGNSIFLLNIPPTREGLFSSKDVDVLKEVGRRINVTYSNDLMDGSDRAKALGDEDIDTYVELKNGIPMEISFPTPVTMNRVMLQEAIASSGERVEKFNIEAFIDGNWQPVASSTNIGYKRIVRLPEITTDKIRITVEESRATPHLASLSAHYYPASAPMLTAERDREGILTIKIKPEDFNWRNYQDKSRENLSMGFEAYYTTDGSEPDNTSEKFTIPFPFENGEIKMVAYLNGNKGECASQRVGYSKKDWSVAECSSIIGDARKAESLIDENPSTYWQSDADDNSPFVTIDLGKPVVFNAFSYTPQNVSDKGLIEEGELLVSMDGEKWDVIPFVFGNLINDPTQRFVNLERNYTGRYIKIAAKRIAGDKKTATIAEFDIYNPPL